MIMYICLTERIICSNKPNHYKNINDKKLKTFKSAIYSIPISTKVKIIILPYKVL